MIILIVTDTLALGGAENFVVRLANRLAVTQTVILANLHPEYSHPHLVAQLDPRVQYRAPKLLSSKLRQKLDGGLLRLNVDGGFLARGMAKFLGRLVQMTRPDVVHSHLFKADYYVARARSLPGVPTFRHVSTNHGDYLLYHRSPPRRILNYERKLQRALRSIDSLINISEEQTIFTQRFGSAVNVRNILCGYEGDTSDSLSRRDLGIEDHDLVFGMVSRGIPEKGWGLLVDAFLSSKLPDTKLVLVGVGPAIDALEARHRNDNRIRFTGFVRNPLTYIQLFDVGVLPSLFKAESLPTAITEYLCCGKAVISTDVGDVRNMLRPGSSANGPASPDDELAGQLVPLPLDECRPDAGPLCDAMRRYAMDRTLLARHQQLARLAFRKFDMDACINAYVDVYERGVRPTALEVE
jgi:L-malate glycosyltransferase